MLCIHSPGLRKHLRHPHHWRWHEHHTAAGDNWSPRGRGHPSPLSLRHRMGCHQQVYEFHDETSKWPSPAVPATNIQRGEPHPQCASATEQRTSAGGKTLVSPPFTLSSNFKLSFVLFLISHKSGLLITTKALYSICLLSHHSLLWRVIVMP